MDIRTIKDKCNPEIALIVLCCRVFLKTADIAILQSYISENSINWARVYELSRVHRIRPVIFNILFQVKDQVDGKTFQLFRSFCINFSSRIFSRKAECDRIIALLQQRGIYARQYKGPAFSKLIYKDVSMRESADLDMIIAEEDLAGVVDTMQKEGYQMKMQVFYDRFPAQFIQLHKDVCFDKEGVFGGSFNFEFHYKPTKYRMNLTTSFRQLLGSDYLSPHHQYDYKDYYTLMIINNGISDHYPTLRSLLDLIFFDAVEFDGIMIQELERYDLLRRMMSAELFSLPFTGRNDDRGLARTSHFLVNDLLNRKEALHLDLVRNTYLGLKLSKGILNKWNTLWRNFVAFIRPNGNDIAGIRLPFYTFYYFTKLFRLIIRRFYFVLHSIRSAP